MLIIFTIKFNEYFASYLQLSIITKISNEMQGINAKTLLVSWHSLKNIYLQGRINLRAHKDYILKVACESQQGIIIVLVKFTVIQNKIYLNLQN